MRSILALIGQEAAFCEVLHQGGSGDPTGPVGWVQGRPRAAGPPHAQYHPLQALRAFRGPLRCTGLGTSLAACWLGTPLVYPPGYPPSIPTQPAPTSQCGLCTVRALVR